MCNPIGIMFLALPGLVFTPEIAAKELKCFREDDRGEVIEIWQVAVTASGLRVTLDEHQFRDDQTIYDVPATGFLTFDGIPGIIDDQNWLQVPLDLSADPGPERVTTIPWVLYVDWANSWMVMAQYSFWQKKVLSIYPEHCQRLD